MRVAAMEPFYGIFKNTHKAGDQHVRQYHNDGLGVLLPVQAVEEYDSPECVQHDHTQGHESCGTHT